MTQIKIGGREIPLSYSAFEIIAIQKEIGCTAFQLKDEVFGIRKVEKEDEPNAEPDVYFDVVKDADKIEKLGKLITILGNAGLEGEGKEPDLTAKWVLRNMKPALILPFAIATMAEINAGNMMEAKREEKGPVDELLEEEQAKKQQGN